MTTIDGLQRCLAEAAEACGIEATVWLPHDGLATGVGDEHFYLADCEATIWLPHDGLATGVGDEHFYLADCEAKSGGPATFWLYACNDQGHWVWEITRSDDEDFYRRGDFDGSTGPVT